MTASLDRSETRFEGRVVGRVGLQMTLWLDPKATQPASWQGVLRAASAYAAWAGQNLAWWSSTARDPVSWLSTMGVNSDDEDVAFDSAEALQDALHDLVGTPFSADALEKAPSKLDSEMLELVLGSSTIGPAAWQDPMDWLFYANVPVEGSEVSGFIRVHVPGGAGGVSLDGANRLREFMRACVQVLPVLHGTGGWGLQLPLSFRYFHVNLYAAVALFELVQAHAGLDVYDPVLALV